MNDTTYPNNFQKQQLEIFYQILIFGFYPVIFLVGCYTIPMGLLSDSNTLGSIAASLQGYLPVFRDFQEKSLFPDESQTLFMLCTLLLPAHIAICFKAANRNRTAKNHEFDAYKLLISVATAIVILAFLATSGNSSQEEIANSRKGGYLLTNRFLFSMITGTTFTVASLAIFASIHQAKLFIKNLIRD